MALPRRDPAEHADLTDALTAHLTKPHVCHPECAKINGRQVIRLNAIQTISLVEAHDTGGLFLQAVPGTGKTLISALLGRLLERSPAVLIVPAALRMKTVREFQRLREHWDIWVPTITTYHKLSSASFALLEKLRPRLLILDEGQCAKNRSGPRAKKLRRFLREHGIDCVVVDMSGTGAKRSLNDAAHRMHWCLKERCPLPIHEPDLVDWSAAVDEKVQPKSRLEAGALRMLCNPDDPPGLEGVRRALGRRMFDTPGAVRSTDPGVDASLYLYGVDLPLSKAEDNAFEPMRDEWKTPDEHPIADAVAVWRHARELALGFYYVWDPRPPFDWLWARQAWCASVRDIITHNRRELDTEFQVADEVRRAIANGKRHEAAEAYKDWHAIKDTFIPNTVPRWVGDTAINAAADWLHSKSGGGIVWTEHRAFAQRLAEIAKVPYFGAKGRDAQGRAIEDFSGPCIASIASNGTGRNLQAWSRGWIASCLPTGTIWEQLLARLHRQGQEADEVEFWVPISCREQIQGFEQARRDAEFHRDLLQDGHPGRLCSADVAMPDFKRQGWAWKEQRVKKKAA